MTGWEQEGNIYYGYYRRLNQTRKDKRIHTAKGGNEVKGKTTGKPCIAGNIPDVFQAWIDSNRAVVKEHGQKQGGNT